MGQAWQDIVMRGWQEYHLHLLMEVKENIFMAKVTLGGLQELKDGIMALESNFILFVEGGISLDNVGRKYRVITVAHVEKITLLTNVINQTSSSQYSILWPILISKPKTIWEVLDYKNHLVTNLGPQTSVMIMETHDKLTTRR